jgi:hypothetical protein
LKAENVRVTLAQQQARPVQRRDVDVRRRNNMLFAGGIGLIVVLGFLLVVLILQTRRQRAQLAALQEGVEYEEQTGEQAENTQLTDADQQQLDYGGNGNSAGESMGARQLPDGTDQLTAANNAKDSEGQTQAGETAARQQKL